MEALEEVSPPDEVEVPLAEGKEEVERIKGELKIIKGDFNRLKNIYNRERKNWDQHIDIKKPFFHNLKDFNDNKDELEEIESIVQRIEQQERDVKKIKGDTNRITKAIAKKKKK